MGWVRGQTGEQKRKEKQRKDLPGLGSGGIRAGRTWLGCGTGCLQGRCITGWERDPLGDRRLPTADNPGRGSRVGAAQGLPRSKEGGTGREGQEGRTSSRDPRPQCYTNELAGPAPAGRMAPSRTRPAAAPPSAPAGGRTEPPASQVAYSLSKAGLLNLQASL